MKLVFDIETNGLYQDATEIWCMVAIDENDKVYTYNPDEIDKGIEAIISCESNEMLEIP